MVLHSSDLKVKGIPQPQITDEGGRKLRELEQNFFPVEIQEPYTDSPVLKMVNNLLYVSLREPSSLNLTCEE